MSNIYKIFFITFLTALTACDLINPAEAIPSYIYVTDFQLNTTATQGTNSNKITDVWVTIGDEFIGVFPIPALIPMLTNGEQTITLEAGIKDNGISSTGKIYPFYTSFQTKVALNPSEVDTLRPVIGYRGETRFAFIEDLERGTPIFGDLIAGNDANRIQITKENAFEGNSALITLDKNNPTVVLGTVNKYGNLTTKNVNVYLELNYKSDADVIFGVIGYKSGVKGETLYEPGFVARADWNKIYFNMSPLVVGTRYDEFQIVLQSILPLQNNVFTKDKASIWLDNIKLVHF